MTDAELRKKHAAERFVNAAIDAVHAHDERERAAARVAKAEAAEAAAMKELCEVYFPATPHPSGTVERHVRYGGDKVIVITAKSAALHVLERE